MAGRSVNRVAGASAVLCAGVLVYASACNHAWDALEPTTGATSSGTAGSGGAGAGGASASSSTTTASGTGGGVTSSSSSGTGGGGPTHCGGTNILSWDFAVDQPDVFDHDGECHLTGGEGVITLPPSSPDWDTGLFETQRAYDSRGDWVFIKVTQVTDQTGGTYSGMELKYDNDDDLFMGVYGGQLKCGFDRGGNEVVPMKQAYDSTAHRYWQLREDQGTIYCETSPDGVTWADAGSFDYALSLLGPPSLLHVRFIATTPPNVAMPGALHIDDLNGGMKATGSWCKASSYTDDFAASGMVPGPMWDRSWTGGNGEKYDQTGGTLNLHFAAPDNEVGYQSSVAYDLTGERVAVQIVQAPTSDAATVFFAVGNNDSTDMYWNVAPDHFECGHETTTNTYTMYTGAAPTSFPAWIGMREANGSLHCEVYVNGMWKSFGALVGSLDPTRLDITLGVATDSSDTPGTYTASFDNYNNTAPP